MLHHRGGAGGSPYTASPTGADAVAFSLPPPPTSPICFTSFQRPPTQLQPSGTSAAFVELPLDGSSGGGGASNLHDDDDMDMPADVVGVSGSGAGAYGSGGSTRWPREETLALIRIRSEMDAAFRNAPLKAPLWEDVARKLAALGYRRSAKKCKEKFENVDKYYRRTKEARAGRQDGKSYRFFSELEALHAAAPQRQAITTTVQQADPQPSAAMAWTPSHAAHLSFSSMSGSESESGDDEFDVDDAAEELGKGNGDGDEREKEEEMMALFEGMMRQVTEKQDAMQRAFLATLDRWESERTAREEAWRRQELARMNRERDQLARDRAAAASRDVALIAFLHRVGGDLPPNPVAAAPPMPASSPRHDAAPPKAEEAWAWAGGGESSGGGVGATPSSRWPKEEVQALIELRTEKEEQYHHETGGSSSKGPLWEDIAAGMRRIGYNRSAKRCKEKWENINKYFKKVKESNKRRPEDSKTCPYFHQLDAMYRKKRVAVAGQASRRELEGKTSNDVAKQSVAGAYNVRAPPGNSETAAPAVDHGGDNEKTEDAAFLRETSVRLEQRQALAADETDSDDDMLEGSYADEANDGDTMHYKTGFQKPTVMTSSGNAPAPTETAAAATSSAPTSSTFLAVQ